MLLMISLVAYGNQGIGKLYGEATESDGQKLYLNKNNVNVDSAIVDNGRFEFKLKNLEPDEYVIIRSDKQGKPSYLMVYLDKYDTFVKLEQGSYSLFNTDFIKATVTGNPTQTAVSEINEIILNHSDLDTLRQAKYAQKLYQIAERGDMATAYAMWKYSTVFSQIMKRDQLLRYTENLNPEIRESIVGKRFLEMFRGILASKAGGKVPDFTLKTVNGEGLTLNNFLKGKKLVLLDFWASWCGPCRKKNPDLVRLYETYHSKGFEVLGISLDTDSVKWQKAIADDKLPWMQVSDLKGWKSEVCAKYGIEGIPYMLLVDEHGNIIAANDELQNFLGETIQKLM